MNSEVNHCHSDYVPSYREPSYQQYKTNYENENRYDSPIFGSNGTEIRTGKGWKPPSIRYRHIEDFKPVPPIGPPPQIRQQTALQKEFYDVPVPEVKEKAVKKETATSVAPVAEDRSRKI